MNLRYTLLGTILVSIFMAQSSIAADTPKYVFKRQIIGVKPTGATNGDTTSPGTSTPTNPGTPGQGGSTPTSPIVGDIEISSNTLTFGNSWVSGPQTTTAVTLSNNTDKPITLANVEVTTGATDFLAVSNCASISNGAACNVDVTFVPQAAGLRTGTLSITTTNGKVHTVNLSGQGQVPEVTLSTPVFTDVILPVSSVPVVVSRLTNNSFDTLTLTQPNLFTSLNPRGGFTIPTTTCGTSLAPGASCDTSLRLNTAITGERSATFSITTAKGIKAVTLTGKVIGGRAMLSPTTLTFAEQLVGTSSPPQSTKLTNIGNAPLIVDSMSFSTGEADFGRSNDCGTPLAPGDFCTINVSMTPSKGGYLSGALNIIHNGGTGASTVFTSGSGRLPDAKILEYNIPYRVLAGKPVTATWITENAVTESFECTNATYVLGNKSAVITPLGPQDANCQLTVGTGIQVTHGINATLRIVKAPTMTFSFSSATVRAGELVAFRVDSPDATQVSVECPSSFKHGTGAWPYVKNQVGQALSLVKDTLVPSQPGQYTCTATVSNEAGQVSASAIINVTN